VEVDKRYYPISEAAKLKGVSVDELLEWIRNGRVPAQYIGMRQMVPAEWVLGKTSGGADEADVLHPGRKGPERDKQYLEQILPDLMKTLKDAPEYGSCGITVTFHKGKIVKVSSQKDITRVEDERHG